jgi:hypothetical protein
MRVNLRKKPDYRGTGKQKPAKNKPEKIKTKGETTSPEKRGGAKAAVKTLAAQTAPSAEQGNAHAEGMAAASAYAAKHQKSPAARRANVEKHLKTARGGK